MERSIVVEENHCKSNVNTVSKSDGPFIQIDSISIDLVSVRIRVLESVYAALVLLRNIISHDLINSYVIIPQDMWDLRLFKRMPSVFLMPIAS
nr:hypothetical protein CFP56_31903 [Quercus suber]